MLRLGKQRPLQLWRWMVVDDLMILLQQPVLVQQDGSHFAFILNIMITFASFDVHFAPRSYTMLTRNLVLWTADTKSYLLYSGWHPCQISTN